MNVTNNFNDDITTKYSKTALNKFMTDVLKRKGNNYYLHERDSIHIETNIQSKKPDRMKRKTFEFKFCITEKMAIGIQICCLLDVNVVLLQISQFKPLLGQL